MDIDEFSAAELTLSFVFDDLNKKLYLKDENLENKFIDTSLIQPFLACQISYYPSLNSNYYSNDFTLIIKNDNNFKSFICFAGNNLTLYDNRLEVIIEHEGTPDYLFSKLFNYFTDIVKFFPTDLLMSYVDIYHLQLDRLSVQEFQAIIMVNY